jgi:preprotein translocase subunit SecE
MAVAEATNPESTSVTARATGWIQQTRDYFDELKKEMKMVSWPSRQQVISTTMVVIAAIFAFALYFWVVDLAIGRAITKLFDSLTK